MTVLNRSQIPPGIGSIEQLVAWGLLMIETQNGARTVREREELLPEKVIQTSTAGTIDGGPRLTSRVSLPLDPSFVADKTKKLWGHVQELSVQSDIPVPYRTD